MSEPADGADDETRRAWEHIYSSAPPELRRWLGTGKPVALHQDLMMVAVASNFTRNLLEGRFRGVIETELHTFFARPVQLAVIVDETLVPADESSDEPTGEFERRDGFAAPGEGGHPPLSRDEFARTDHYESPDFRSPPEFDAERVRPARPRPQRLRAGGVRGQQLPDRGRRPAPAAGRTRRRLRRPQR